MRRCNVYYEISFLPNLQTGRSSTGNLASPPAVPVKRFTTAREKGLSGLRKHSRRIAHPLSSVNLFVWSSRLTAPVNSLRHECKLRTNASRNTRSRTLQTARIHLHSTSPNFGQTFKQRCLKAACSVPLGIKCGFWNVCQDTSSGRVNGSNP